MCSPTRIPCYEPPKVVAEQVERVVIEPAFEVDLAAEDRVADGDIAFTPSGDDLRFAVDRRRVEDDRIVCSAHVDLQLAKLAAYDLDVVVAKARIDYQLVAKQQTVGKYRIATRAKDDLHPVDIGDRGRRGGTVDRGAAAAAGESNLTQREVDCRLWSKLSLPSITTTPLMASVVTWAPTSRWN